MQQVIIDNYAYNKFQEARVPMCIRLFGQSRSRWSDHASDLHEELPEASTIDGGSRSTSVERDVDLRPLTDDECLLCVPIMHGFDFHDKKWCKIIRYMSWVSTDIF